MRKDGQKRTIKWYFGQMWRDLLSVYYANTPIWRWFKSGALVFLGLSIWTGAAVVLSVRPEWGLLTYVIAYGFLLLIWGPFTHFVVVPMTIRLRRTATHPVVRAFSRNSGKLNLAIFFTLVLVLGTVTPAIMMLEFAPLPGNNDRVDVRGELQCEIEDELVSCLVAGAQGIDHVVVTSGGEEIAVANEPPFALQFHTDEVHETRTGKEFTVDYRDEDGETIRRFVRTVPG